MDILERCATGRLPKAARDFANGALETANGIYDTMEDMGNRLMDVPTEAQAAALNRIHRGACKWLHLKPEA
ncbi:MAG TPA: hypothetical protein PKL14_03760 [Holophaga sp.]|nr:hypothetical protein [Holophaga sp.]